MRVDGIWFKDDEGRRLMLRGVNLSGSAKVPYRPDGASHLPETYYNHRDVSFVGRPFPLEEADEHFKRLKSWGFTFLRFLITWEALEHAGPGMYDEEYLDYLVKVIRKAGEYGIDVFIDPHEDVWSRFTGGDGAPGWTLEMLGMDLSNMLETGAAIVHNLYGDPFPRMIWSSNNDKMAAATLFTLFFAGNDFAPKTLIEGVPVQEYLQGHYINALKEVVKRLKGLPNVVGYDSLNEPACGWVGVKDIRQISVGLWHGDLPTPLQGIALASGIPQTIEVWRQGIPFRKKLPSKLVNPRGASLWKPGYECVWKQNGVWDVGPDGQPRALKPDYFYQLNGRAVDFQQDYMLPFINRVARELRSIDPGAILFIETTTDNKLPVMGPDDARNIVNASHWYDNIPLFVKDYYGWYNFDSNTSKLYVGRANVQRMCVNQLAALKAGSQTALGGAPTLVGEFGIQFDYDDGRAYRDGNFSKQIDALDNSYRAMEANLLNSTLWNYTADNTNARGDQWNGEDLSLFSRDQQKDPADINSGGRALQAAVRPYPAKTAGDLLHMSFDYKKGCFEMEFQHDPQVSASSEIFVPNYQYPNGYTVEVSDGSYEQRPETQTLVYQAGAGRETHTVKIIRK
jgi:hypothetical protein